MRLISTSFILVLCLGISPFLLGQGLILNDKHYIDFPIYQRSDGAKDLAHSVLDTIYKVSLKAYCPLPKDQKNDANCVGWSVGYSAQSIRQNYKHDIRDKAIIRRTAFSPHFIYNQIKLKDCKLGAEIIDALSLLVTSGNVYLEDFSSAETNCELMPDQKLLKTAHNNRINDFVKLFDPASHKSEKINNVKLALVKGYPVIIALEVIESFFKLEKGEKLWYSELGSPTPVGGHALTVIGFDETSKAFELMNSWGPNWANDGFVWIDYEDFAKYSKYGFRFDDNYNENFSIQVNFRRKVLITSNDEVHFANELFKYENGVYSPVNKYAKKGSVYQFQFYNSRKDYLIYCLNKSSSLPYSILMKVNGENYDEHGFVLPGINTGVELTDEKSEEFLFVITRNELPGTWEKSISTMKDFEELKDSIESHVRIKKDTRHSYNKVSFISELNKEEAVVLRVNFNFEN